MISEDDPVRLVDEVLAGMDWSDWEAFYERQGGQPPIHPRCVAAAMLYGMYRGIRSTRKLEEACRYRFDFVWLVEGRRIDHTTFNKFRTKFRGPLKNLFKKIGRMAMTMGLIRLGEVAFDGTRVKANNSRYRTRTVKTLEEKLKGLDELFEQMMDKMNATDREEADLGSPTRLPEELAGVEQRRQRLREALEEVKAAEEARRQEGIHAENAQVPITDPSSRVMPNKEGGFAPNYTPTITTDGHRGFIVDGDVLAEVSESSALAPSVERMEETFGRKPEKMLTDGGNNGGHTMEEMEKAGVEFYAPVSSNQPQEGNPAKRDDPRQPVPESEWSKLPRNSHGQLDKSCFVYNSQEDQYYCPRGEAMPWDKTKRERRGGVQVDRRVYRCLACVGCPLAMACLSAKSKGGRTITRDQYEEVRERTAARMASESGRKTYNQRPRIAETTFGILKAVMGIRQFLLRGLEKVKTEWLWAMTSFNLMKLARETARMRAEFSKLASGAAA
jgi:transposase